MAIPRSRAVIGRRAACAIGAMLLAALAACSGSSDEPPAPTLVPGTMRITTASALVLEVRSDPIVLGKNTLTIAMITPGSELLGASALMPAHGHGSRPPIVEKATEPATWTVRDLIFYMSGRWELRLDVSVDGKAHEAVLIVDVP